MLVNIKFFSSREKYMILFTKMTPRVITTSIYDYQVVGNFIRALKYTRGLLFALEGIKLMYNVSNDILLVLLNG